MPNKALNRALTPLMQHLTLLCSQAKSQVETNPTRGIEVVRDLDGAKISPPQDTQLSCRRMPRRSAAHDEVAFAIRGCLIDYANKTEAWRRSPALFENCLALAQEPSLRATLSEDIAVLQGNLDLQRRAQSPAASATTAPRSGRANTGSTQRGPQTWLTCSVSRSGVYGNACRSWEK